MRLHLKLLFGLVIITQAISVSAQKDLRYFLPTDVTYDPNIPTPKSIIGHEVGEWHITHDKLVLYMRALANASNRITLEEIGQTHEGRTQLLLTITHPDNQAGIEKIRTDHVWLTYPNESDKFDIKKMPVVAYMGFSIHGNEPSGSNAALIAAYYMAAAQGPKIENALRNSIILFDPSFNPDGLTRFSTWANMHKSKNINPDPNDREYSEVWPGGRTNHYWFDLNRDWLPVQQPESKNRIAKYHLWKPNILTDHHEMGTNSTFFFQPGVPTRTHPLTPKTNQELTSKIGEYHAEGLDGIGSLYYTKEGYDDFYYGKGSTFPDINGGIGILFEQASSRGHAQESDNGILEFPFTIKNQFTAVLSTWKAAIDMRVELLDYQRDFYKRVLRDADSDETKAYIFKAEKDAARSYHLAEILDRQEIDFYRPARDLKFGNEEYKMDNSYIIPLKQRNYKLIKGMFEKRTTFEDSLFYDISGWTYPLAFNVEYAELTSREYGRNQLGQKVDKVEFPQGKMIGGQSAYAYAFEWHGYYAPRAANRLLSKGIRIKVATSKFSKDEETTFDYGTILVPVANQKLSEFDLFLEMQAIANLDGLDIHALNSGLTNGVSLGSNSFISLEKPEIALVVESGSSADAGEIWHLLDTRMQMLVTKLPENRLSSNAIERYNTLIITGGVDLSEAELENLKRWIRNGGTLIASNGSAAAWASRNKLTNVQLVDVEQYKGENVVYDQLSNFQRGQSIPGGVFMSELELTHPLAFGYYRKELPTFRRGNVMLEASKNKFSNPGKYTKEPLLSGWINKPNLEALKETSTIRVNALGQGRIVSLADNPNFRAFWYGTNKLMMNAIFFGRIVSSAAAR
ncbi:MAG: zinc carboxypeptidase [Cytophagales bacterium CG12_big_fil_rev_8_21_14_0_65_40_12]|nr:MAG: zinc carboxypeptidase [Cytophagales bacterium CG12_big_fil_rev_8_21_14_0_65_40_12]PIW03044.1 MAG: zinc carboxypeptidase [Cytophagales bacterium CG17_big_fil_post_rev_8_21_14_2_50_40_13]